MRRLTLASAFILISASGVLAQNAQNLARAPVVPWCQKVCHYSEYPIDLSYSFEYCIPSAISRQAVGEKCGCAYRAPRKDNIVKLGIHEGVVTCLRPAGKPRFLGRDRTRRLRLRDK